MAAGQTPWNLFRFAISKLLPVSFFLSQDFRALGVGCALGVGVGYCFFKGKTATAKATIRQCAVGDSIPAVPVFEGFGNNIVLPELFGSGKNILFGLPGAFTPG